MITANCTHPPMVLVLDKRITPEVMAVVIEQIQRVVETRAVPVLDGGGRLEVIECSHCRNPDAAVEGGSVDE